MEKMKEIDNDHRQEYYDIIENAQNQERVKSKDEYFENHHIIPSSLGGSDSKENMILLTPEEHYQCHALLPHFLEGDEKSKMMCAWNMTNGNGMSGKDVDGESLIGEEKYGDLKRAYSEMMSDRMSGESNPMFGKSSLEGKTDDEKKEIGDKRSKNMPWKGGKRPEHSEVMKGEGNPMFGKSAFEDKTEEEMETIKDNMSESHKGEKNAMFGVSPFEDKTEEEMETIKDNMSKANKKRWESVKPVTCPHCGLIGRGGVMKRYHFDNCKEKK